MANDLPLPPARPDDGHKGTFGTVVVLAGSTAMPGAAALCCRAAFRAGAGLVKLAAPRGVWPVVQTQLASVTMLEVGALGSLDWEKTGTVLAAGPGLGDSSDTRKALASVMAVRAPLVLDADGINLLAAGGLPARDRNCRG